MLVLTPSILTGEGRANDCMEVFTCFENELLLLQIIRSVVE